jgi:GNAT superfamily N-acetyltransferase
MEQIKLGFVDQLHVESAYEGLGIRSSLIEKSAQWLRGNNVNAMQVFVSLKNGSMETFFNGVGFRPLRIFTTLRT